MSLSTLQLAHDLVDLHCDEMGSRAQKCFTIGRIDARKCGLSRVWVGKRMCLTVRAKSPKGAIVLNLRGGEVTGAAGREPEACGVTDPVSPRAASPGSGAAICAGTSADSGMLSRHQKFFCKNVFHTKATPFMGRTIFGQVFVRGDMTKI
jgi:hypothetical protein